MTIPILVTALGCGLVAAADGVAAMQSMNDPLPPAFLIAFVGTALACVGVGIWALVDWDGRRSPFVLAGSARC